MSDNRPVLQNDELHRQADGVKIVRKRYAELSDNELLRLIGTSQDREALSELYSRYQLPIARFLKRHMSNTKLVEEVYNDVMLTVWQKASGFRGDSKVSTWLFGIAYRTRLTHYRKESRHDHVGTDEIMSNMACQEQAETDSQDAINENLRAAISELSEQHRAVIELAYFHGYSTGEIANIVQVPQNTVKTRLFHARKKLKAVLEADQSGDAEDGSCNAGADNFNDNSSSPNYHFAGYSLFAMS